MSGGVKVRSSWICAAAAADIREVVFEDGGGGAKAVAVGRRDIDIVAAAAPMLVREEAFMVLEAGYGK